MTTDTPTSADPVVSFIVPVRNDAARLRRCLASIARASSGHDVEIVVVDNGSEDGSRDVASAGGARVLTVSNAAVARLRNEGVAIARSDLLAFVDADHEISEQWVDAAMARLADPDVAAVGAQYHAPRRSTWVQRTYDRFRTHALTARDAAWLGSGNLVVRRGAFAAIGGFDARLHACEDVDLCARLRKAGFRLIEDPALYSQHLGDPETLRMLFKSELWRGRNNLSVTLSSELSVRSLVSLAIPAINLAALVVVAIGGIRTSPAMVAGGVAVIVALAAIRAAALLRRRDVSIRSTAECLLVATVYHVARGLALVWPAKHRRARMQTSVAARSAR